MDTRMTSVADADRPWVYHAGGVSALALGVVSVVGSFFGNALSAGIIVTSMLTTVWVIFVGFRLCGLGRRLAQDAQA
jgi:hypothetical protein